MMTCPTKLSVNSHGGCSTNQAVADHPSSFSYEPASPTMTSTSLSQSVCKVPQALATHSLVQQVLLHS
jgi:hypothetical protein